MGRVACQLIASFCGDYVLKERTGRNYRAQMLVRPSRYRTIMAAAWELLSLSPQTRNRPLHPGNRANYHPEQSCQSQLFIPPRERRRERIKTTFIKCIRFNSFNCRGLMCQTLSFCLSFQHFSDKPINSIYNPRMKAQNVDFFIKYISFW